MHLSLLLILFITLGANAIVTLPCTATVHVLYPLVTGARVSLPCTLVVIVRRLLMGLFCILTLRRLLLLFLLILFS